MSTRKFGGRTLARSQALQLLFQAEALGRSVREVLAGPYALSQDDPLDEYGEQLALGTDDMRHELDSVISNSSTNWSIERMPSVDRNLLRLAIYEMLEVDEVAIAVTIDESVELAKAYGTDESSRFINGLLGKVASDMESGARIIESPEVPEVEASESAAPEVEVPEAEDPEGTPETEAPAALVPEATAPEED